MQYFYTQFKGYVRLFLLQGVNTVVLRASASISVLYGIFQKAEESGLMSLEILFKSFGFNTILLTLFKE